MARTTADIDERALARAGEELSTTGPSATVNAALTEIGRRRALQDFDVLRDVDGDPAEVEANRQARHSAR